LGVQPPIARNGESPAQLLRITPNYRNQGRTIQFVIVDLGPPRRMLSARAYLFVDVVLAVNGPTLEEIRYRVRQVSSGDGNLHLLHGLYYFVEFQFRGSLHVHPFTNFG
jgi:hypothetical protein